VRYALMMLRFAQTIRAYNKFRGKLSPEAGMDVMAERQFAVWHSVRDEHGNYSWRVADGLVFVRTANGRKSTQIGGSSPDHIARILARELDALAKCDDC
jgi:hypothetical protein